MIILSKEQVLKLHANCNFFDIHGNHAAFEQCVKYALTNNINRFIFLDDYLVSA